MKPGVRTAIFALALLLIGGMGVVQWLAERRLVEAQSRVPHTLRVIEVKQELLTRLVDAETGQRGFLLTGDPEYLDPFRDAEGDAWRLIASLRQLTHEIPAQQERLDVLEPLVRTHFDGLDQRIAVRESQGLEEAVRLLEENREKANLDAIRTLLADLERQEFELLALRSTRADRISTATHLVTALGTLLALFLFGWAFLSFRREALQRRQAEREEARLRAQLIEQREAAVEVSRMKSEFLANMSHEIRTPMNGVLGMTELLSRTDLDRRQREYVQMIQKSASALLRILNDILDISKLEAGKVRIEHTPFPLDERVGDTVKSFAPTAFEKNIELSYYIDAEVPEWIRGDPHRIGQIVFNLVGNAVKFTERGEVSVRVTRAAASDPKPEPGQSFGLRLVIRDTGIGISEEQRGRIFEAFGQADASTTRRYGGSGLGLSITGELTRLMGGALELESELGVGSTFTVALPVEAAEPQAQSPKTEPSDRGTALAFSKLRCLVVDDNETNRRWLRDMLRSWGCTPVLAGSADEGLQRYHEARDAGQDFDLLLVDRAMPGADGFDLVRRLKDSEPEHPPVVVMLSSMDDDAGIALCERLSIDEYMVKPVKRSEVYNAILKVLGAAPSVQESSGEEPLPPCETPLEVLVAEDNPVNQRLVQEILGARGHRVTIVVNGREALDALDAGAYDVVLMDVQMPILDGMAATRALRHSEAGTDRHLPVVGFTAHALTGDREACLEAGMDGYLPKPVNPDLLIRTIEEMADDGRRSPARTPPSPGDGPGSVASGGTPASEVHRLDPVFDREAGRAATLGKEDLLADMARLALDEIEQGLREIRSLRDAGDAEAVSRRLHRLKGSLSHFTVPALREQIQALERYAENAAWEKFDADFATVGENIGRLDAELREFLDEGAPSDGSST